MTREHLYVHDPMVMPREAAIANATALGVPFVVHGLSRWMVAQGITLGPDGAAILVMCPVPSHAAQREVLARLPSNATRQQISAVESHVGAATPPIDNLIIDAVEAIDTSTITDPQARAALEELKAVLLLGRHRQS